MAGEASLDRQTLRQFWAGKLPLPIAFWRFGVLYGTLLNIAGTCAALTAVSADLPPWVGAVLFALPIPYNAMAAFAVWRSAATWRGAPMWSHLARYGIIGWAALASVI